VTQLFQLSFSSKPVTVLLMAWLNLKLLNPLVALPHVLVMLQDIDHIQCETAKLCQTEEQQA
jgi:hypothetical protein